MNHFTDQAGYNAIGSQPIWTFKAEQPRAVRHPVGAYFTTYEPTEPNLAKKIFVPLVKLAYIFRFESPRALTPLPGGRGRLGKIFYSANDYYVDRLHQLEAKETRLG